MLGNAKKARVGRITVTTGKEMDFAVHGGKSHPGAQKTVRFGSVTVVVRSPSSGELVRNIKAGQTAFRRAKDIFSSPGAKIRVSRDVPFFSVDPKDPRYLIRKLAGKKERVILNGGHKFEVCG
jgi:hypothetical protein